MNSRRKFLLGLPLATVGVASAQTTNRIAVDGADFAKTVEELKKGVLFANEWKEATFAKRKFVFVLTNQGDGESYVDLHGWIYNRAFKEWRRILNIKTRGIGYAKLLVDEKKGVLLLRGAANNELNNVDVFRFDLRATSDDSSYEKYEK
jgi:hypothetical protein